PNSHTPRSVVPVPYLSSMPTSSPAQVAASTRATMENSLPAGAIGGDDFISIFQAGCVAATSNGRGHGSDTDGQGGRRRELHWSGGSGRQPRRIRSRAPLAGALLQACRQAVATASATSRYSSIWSKFM